MARALRKSFVISVSVLAASCATKGRKVSDSHVGKPTTIDWANAKTLNPQDDKHRTIYASGDTCFVHVPFSEPQTSWQPPKTKNVDCPPSMDDPAWDSCPGGAIVLSHSECACTSDGNPPPPPVKVDCPK